MEKNICSFYNCKRNVLAKGFCSKHYKHFHLGKLGLVKERERHGLEGTPEYEIWKSMKQRCINPNSRDYKNYGGRGIKVSKEWLNSFATFYKDMGNRPTKDYTLERKNNDLGYSKSNCKWATRYEQAINQRDRISTKHRNISLHTKSGCWRVRIQRNGIFVYSTSFGTLNEAIVARDKFLIRYTH